jgi:ribosomal protein L12E/L44/L45/RPP1/RPP2
MVLCSVDEVRARVYSSTLTDSDILDIITEVSAEVLALAEATDSSNPLLILAGKNAAWAATLRKMKTTGEMAASIQQGNSQQQNTIDADIKAYDEKAAELIQKYKDSVKVRNVSIPFGRVGFGTVNNTL